MNPEHLRNVQGALRALASLEALADGGIEDLYEMTNTTAKAISAQGPHLRLDPEPGREHGSLEEWNVSFAQRVLLRFQVVRGKTPSCSGSVARCTVNTDHLSMVFHYVKVNDHGVWQCVSEDLSDALPVTEDMLLDLLGDALRRGLSRFK